MSDNALVLEILKQVRGAVERILLRFKPVESISFFLDAEAVFNVCETDLPEMLTVLEQMIFDVENTRF